MSNNICMENLEYYQDKFVERLKELMFERGINSIVAFGKIIDIPRRTINSWINKKSTPHIEALIKLATHFDVPTDYLLGLVDTY